MKQVAVAELKDRLSQYLRLVKAGETIEITERSVPIALLTRRSPRDSRERALDELVRDRLVVGPKRAPDLEALKQPPVHCRGDVLAALVDARGER
jgi:prevent-host-death family protein